MLLAPQLRFLDLVGPSGGLIQSIQVVEVLGAPVSAEVYRSVLRPVGVKLVGCVPADILDWCFLKDVTTSLRFEVV